MRYRRCTILLESRRVFGAVLIFFATTQGHTSRQRHAAARKRKKTRRQSRSQPEKKRRRPAFWPRLRLRLQRCRARAPPAWREQWWLGRRPAAAVVAFEGVGQGAMLQGQVKEKNLKNFQLISKFPPPKTKKKRKFVIFLNKVSIEKKSFREI